MLLLRMTSAALTLTHRAVNESASLHLARARLKHLLQFPLRWTLTCSPHLYHEPHTRHFPRTAARHGDITVTGKRFSCRHGVSRQFHDGKVRRLIDLT